MTYYKKNLSAVTYYTKSKEEETCFTGCPCFSVANLCLTFWNLRTTACQAPLSSTIYQSLLKFMSILGMTLSNRLILCVSFSSCLKSFPALGSFPMTQFFASSGQSFGASASASVLPMNIQSLFPLVLTGLISLQSKGVTRVFSNMTVQKHQFFITQPSLWSNSHIHTWWPKKNIALTTQVFVSKVMFLLFNNLSRFFLTVLPKNKHLLILW